jgi:hypothetical protein
MAAKDSRGGRSEQGGSANERASSPTRHRGLLGLIVIDRP